MFGRVLVVGGHEEMIGAPVLAGAAALRMGAGLVQLAVPRAILAACLSITPELIGHALTRGNRATLAAAADSADAIVLGPGLGKSPEAAGRVMQLIRLDKPMIIDADALNILSMQKRWPTSFKARAVLTPHPGEMKRLAKFIGRDEVPRDDAGRRKIATEAARTFGQVVVLKGARTVVSDGRQIYVNQTGDSSLSKAGSGDVLSGILGTLLAQQVDGFVAACIATWIHGRAGEIAGRQFSQRCVLARDVIDSIPRAVAEYEQIGATR